MPFCASQWSQRMRLTMNEKSTAYKEYSSNIQLTENMLRFDQRISICLVIEKLPPHTRIFIMNNPAIFIVEHQKCQFFSSSLWFDVQYSVLTILLHRSIWYLFCCRSGHWWRCVGDFRYDIQSFIRSFTFYDAISNFKPIFAFDHKTLSHVNNIILRTYLINVSFFIFLVNRFINARRRIVQPMIDQSNRAGNIL